MLLQDGFDGSEGSAIDSAKWSVYLDTVPSDEGWGDPGGAVFQTGNGWAEIEPASQWTGSGFYSANTFPNTGSYTIRAGLYFDHGDNWANNVFVRIRAADDPAERNVVYLHPLCEHLLYNIQTPWETDPFALSSIKIQFFHDGGTYDDPVWSDSQHTWAETHNIVDLRVDYNADTGETAFKVWDRDTGNLVAEVSTTVPEAYRTALGSDFRIELGMDGYDAVPDYWDYVEVTPEPATLSLLAVGIGAVMLRRRRR